MFSIYNGKVVISEMSLFFLLPLQSFFFSLLLIFSVKPLHLDHFDVFHVEKCRENQRNHGWFIEIPIQGAIFQNPSIVTASTV